jgi:hypothetical protein
MRENRILSSESAFGIMYRYAIVLRKTQRRGANAVKAQAKALKMATQPAYCCKLRW